MTTKPRPALTVTSVIITVGVSCVAALCLAACGSGRGGRVVVLVDGDRLRAGAVAHWVGVRAHGGIVAAPASPAGMTPRDQALSFLISSRWLLDEVADQGERIDERAVRRRLEELKQAVPGGDSAFAESLKSARETLADVRLEIETELARAAIQRRLALGLGAVGRDQLLRYYRAHLERFRVPEQRDIDIVENLPSPAAARTLVARVGTGSRFTQLAYQESPNRPEGFADDAKRRGRTGDLLDSARQALWPDATRARLRGVRGKARASIGRTAVFEGALGDRQSAHRTGAGAHA